MDQTFFIPLFTHPGHVGALDELGQQGPGAIPALVGVAALLRVALLLVVAAAAPLELALVVMAPAAAAAVRVVAPSAAVASAAAAAVHDRLARRRAGVR